MKHNKVRTAVSLILVGMYVAGLAALFMKRARLGVGLWVASTLGGIALLYWVREMNRRAEDAAKIARGEPYGEPEAPAVPTAPKEDDAR